MQKLKGNYYLFMGLNWILRKKINRNLRNDLSWNSPKPYWRFVLISATNNTSKPGKFCVYLLIVCLTIAPAHLVRRTGNWDDYPVLS